MIEFKAELLTGQMVDIWPILSPILTIYKEFNYLCLIKFILTLYMLVTLSTIMKGSIYELQGMRKCIMDIIKTIIPGNHLNIRIGLIWMGKHTYIYLNQVNLDQDSGILMTETNPVIMILTAEVILLLMMIAFIIHWQETINLFQVWLQSKLN